MATKYWYKASNGSDAWSVAANWYLGSGGTGGTTTVPGNADDVILDTNSGNGTLTIAAASSCRSLVATTFKGTLTGTFALTMAGSNGGSQGSGKTLELGPPGVPGVGMTYSLTGGLSLAAVTSSGSINFNGQSHSTGTMTINAAAGIWTLAGNLTTTGTISFVAGSLTTNGYTVTCSTFTISGSGVRTLNLGSSLINLTGSGSPWSFVTSATNVTFNVGTSTIRFSDTSSASCTFLGNSRTYYNFEVARGASTGTVVFQSSSGGNSGSNTFFNFIDNTGTAAHSITFLPSSPQTFENFNVRGASTSARITFIAGTAGATSLTKIGAGAVICDYLDLGANVTSVTPANTWYAGYNSIGTGDGWVLRNPPGLLLMGVGG